MNKLNHLASTLGDPMRLQILWTLLDGRAFTAGELAITIDTTSQNCSQHLAKLMNAGFIRVEPQGRHRYYSLATPEIAHAIEALAGITAPITTTPPLPPIKFCRTCYDHLAGKVGVLITDSLISQRIILRKEKQFIVTPKGSQWFAALDINTETLQQLPRSFARVCIDWSERRPHLAGSLGASLLQKMRDEAWIRPIAQSRAVIVTPKGEKALYEHLKLSLPAKG